jgi:(2Fe-2S) ferredoxin
VSGATEDPPLFYRAHVFCCTNERPEGHPRGCCKGKGSERLRNYMKARAKELGLKDVRINAAGCLDRCELGPCMVIYPEGVWYSVHNKADVDEVLNVHVKQGGRVQRLMLQPDQRPPKG